MSNKGTKPRGIVLSRLDFIYGYMCAAVLGTLASVQLPVICFVRRAGSCMQPTVVKSLEGCCFVFSQSTFSEAFQGAF